MKKTLIALLLIVSVVFMPAVFSSAEAKSEYSSYVTARTSGSGLVLEPTLILEPNDINDIPTGANLSASGVTSVMFTPDKDMNVVLGSETTAFTELFNTHVKGKFIAVLRLDENTVDGFIDMMNNVYTIKDVIVVSKNLSVLKKIYDDKVSSIANAVYDLTDVKIPSGRYDTWEYIAQANGAYANVLMYDASDENFAVAAEYAGSMTKVCWGYADGTGETVSAIADGATGIVVRNADDYNSAIKFFSKKGFSKAQYVAAHRGITAYANENSEMAVAAAVSEGSTHAEIDIQFTRDGEFIVCHDMVSSNFSVTKGVNFEPTLSSYSTTLKLNDYSIKYGDCFPLLDQIIQTVYKSDLILIIELKLEDGRTSVVNKGAIEKFVALMNSYPYMKGRWFCITFYKPYADQMREFAPEIPVGFLGGATSGYEKDSGLTGWNGEWTLMSNVSSKIAFMHKYKTVLDENYSQATSNTSQTYLARGYLQNGWTFEDVNHFGCKINIATTNAAEKCADCIKSIEPQNLSMTRDDLSKGKIIVDTVNYNGWKTQRECDVITVSESLGKATVLLYYYETFNGANYGLYSQLLTYEII